MIPEAHLTGSHTGFSHKYNTDDVLLRSVIVSLINSLNEQIFFENIVSDSVKNTVRVPFFYAFSGDERFIQDYFTNWSDCVPNFLEGNYDPIPRGSLVLTGVSVQSSNLTSRFVRGFYDKEVNGELLRYNSYLNSIPVSMQFNVKILTDTVLDAFKINQEIMRVFYKTMVFRVNFAGSVVPSQVGFPEAYNMEKQFEYTYGESNRVTLSFDIEVETYYPIFDEKQQMFAGSRIENVVSGVTAGNKPLPTPTVSTDSTYDITRAAQSTPTGPFLKDIEDNSKFSGDYWE